MSMHTAGPWRIQFAGGAHVILSGSRSSSIAQVVAHDAEDAANARLIATAPELLEALRDAAKYLSYGVPESHPLLQGVDAAIAKAEGRAP